MSKTILAQTYRVGAPGASYDAERVTADPRAAGLARDVGTIVEVIGSQGAYSLQKYTTWDKGWRPPGAGPLYPKTATEFNAATKITPSALYLMDLMTGDLFDAAGNGNTLAVNGTTPTVQQTLEDKIGAYFDASGDGYLADKNDPATASFVWGGEAAQIADPGGAGLNGSFGRRATTNEGFFFFCNPAGTLQYFVKDAAGLTIGAAMAGVPSLTANPRVPYLFSGQVDKSAGGGGSIFRWRVSRGGSVVASATVAPGVFGTFTFAGQVYNIGGNISFGGIFGGMWVAYNYFATGTQCEGVNVLRDIHVGLGWEV